ncbi:MAG: DUF1330 domain-containing protein [Halioglobus sp.]
MAAYAILEVDVHDIAEYLVHQQRLAPLLESVGARYLARGGEARQYEGSGELWRLMVLEFPSLEALDEFYTGDAYQNLRAHRDGCSRSRIVAVAGL